ncbi:hypothetical protein B7486_20030 [cyanobacterium TDX16]|nr:hypothetical protein B7486_20030 [cyanobacterium TDX16]
MTRLIVCKIIALIAVSTSFVGTAMAQSNIDNTVPNKRAWSENTGWTNWRDANAAAQGVRVGGFVLQGFIWSENTGWINVGDGTPGGPGGQYANIDGTDSGVNVDSDGTLHGYAWGENVGWINFDGGATASPAQPARINCAPFGELARLTGFVWGENIGWINLSDINPGKFVSVDAATTPLACDMNRDGTDNGADVQLFVTHLIDGMGDWRDVCSGDQTGDLTLDLGDVAMFVDCLLTKP